MLKPEKESIIKRGFLAGPSSSTNINSEARLLGTPAPTSPSPSSTISSTSSTTATSCRTTGQADLGNNALAAPLMYGGQSGYTKLLYGGIATWRARGGTRTVHEIEVGAGRGWKVQHKETEEAQCNLECPSRWWRGCRNGRGFTVSPTSASKSASAPTPASPPKSASAPFAWSSSAQIQVHLQPATHSLQPICLCCLALHTNNVSLLPFPVSTWPLIDLVPQSTPVHSRQSTCSLSSSLIFSRGWQVAWHGMEELFRSCVINMRSFDLSKAYNFLVCDMAYFK